MCSEVNDALLQLEDHLGDIDMARDFRTLGGWPHLVDLLHHRHHEYGQHQWGIAWGIEPCEEIYGVPVAMWERAGGLLGEGACV